MNTRKFNFNKWWLTGFTQADGGFVVNFDSRKEGNLPYYPRPSFVLTQNIREEQMMIELHKYLGVGKLYYSRNEINIVIRSLEDINNIMIPHFDNHPLRGHKLSSYLIFKQVVLMINEGKHLSPRETRGFLQILELCYFANHTTRRNLDTKQIILDKIYNKFGFVQFEPIIESNLSKPASSPINTDYMVGLVDGDGSFNFGFKSTRRRIVPNFTIVQGIEDRSVLEDVQSYLNCGKVYDLQSQTSRYQVENVSDLVEKVLPEFKENVFNTTKQDYFNNVVEAWLILAKQGIKEDKDLIKVVELVYNMNLDGKSRKQTKEDYLKQFVKSPAPYKIL